MVSGAAEVRLPNGNDKCLFGAQVESNTPRRARLNI